ncbi:TPA: glycine zipper family protein, partial [Enterobacter cloacae]|nr:glycine zipper family protein [Enterobacter cloacae]
MKAINTALVISILLFSTSGMAMDKTAAGAVAGAAIGAATGKDLKSTVGGAVVGAGTGAMFKNGDKGKAARK